MPVLFQEQGEDPGGIGLVVDNEDSARTDSRFLCGCRGNELPIDLAIDRLGGVDGLGQRKSNREGTAEARAITLGGDGAAMPFDEALDEGEADSQSPAVVLGSLGEEFKELREEFRIDA